MKVLLICHFWSSQLTNLLDSKRRKDPSPWIQEILNLFENRNDLELIVLAPNYDTNRDIVVEHNNIKYYLFKYSPTILCRLFYPLVPKLIKHDDPRKISERIANLLTGYLFPKFRIKRIINKIHPDIIHLYGTENPEYAVGVLPFLNKSKYKILVSLQGFVFLQPDKSFFLSRLNHYWRVKYEKYINERISYLTVSPSGSLYFKYYSNVPKIFELTPITKDPKIDASLVDKEYDIVFYAKVTKDKGIEELIKAVGYLKNELSREVTVLVMGFCESNYLVKLKDNLIKAGIDHQFCFTGFILDHREVYSLASKAKIMVLPTHNDGFNNTIREAMLMRIPVITTALDTITFVNNDDKCALLYNIGDFIGIANGIMEILDDNSLKQKLTDNAFALMKGMFSIEAIYIRIVEIYRLIYHEMNSNS